MTFEKVKTLRIVAAGLGATVSFLVCGPIALLGIFTLTVEAAPMLETLLVCLCGVVALAGPFALVMAASLSEGQYTRGNRRFLVSGLLLGVVSPLLLVPATLRTHEYAYSLGALVAALCMLVVAWCITRRKQSDN
jgi:hypothetical protein